MDLAQNPHLSAYLVEIELVSFLVCRFVIKVRVVTASCALHRQICECALS